jgi:hypothetical protein
MTGTTPAAAPVKRLTIPKDDATPDSPVVTLAQSDLKAPHPEVTTSTDLLSLRNIGGAFREKPLVLSFGTTSSVFLYFS